MIYLVNITNIRNKKFCYDSMYVNVFSFTG
nr:MAG TPA: hypothetical protein [Caudoviricetes sp.]